jgi:3-oxoacyl-[acyl-carrier protein] reductase
MSVTSEKQVALVTGADTGPGRSVAAALRDAGSVVHEHENVSVHSSLSVDLTEEAHVQNMISQIADAHGRLDVLVACHARPAPSAFFDGQSSHFWDQIDGMLTSSFLVVRAAAELMAHSAPGRIVLLSSGWSSGAKGLEGLAAASAGVDLLVRTLAHELGPKGVCVNAIAPAFLDDEQWLKCDAAALGISVDELRARAHEIVPDGKLGSCEALTRLVMLLCNPSLGAAIGQVVHCSGGYFRHRI